MQCRFVSEDRILEGHTVRALEIICPDGFVGGIYVTREPAFSIKGLNTWHYEISQDGKTITLTGIGTNSVDFGPHGPHITITDWPLVQ